MPQSRRSAIAGSNTEHSFPPRLLPEYLDNALPLFDVPHILLTCVLPHGGVAYAAWAHFRA